MAVVSAAGMRSVHMGDLAADMMRHGDGVIHVRSRTEFSAYPRSLIDRLEHWANVAPERVLLADRGSDGEWRRLTYAEALSKSRSIAQHLLDRGLSADRPLAILSGNSLEHGLLMLGAMTAGIPYAPVSPAYSLVSSDHAKLKHIFSLLTPGLVFVAEGKPFANALSAVMTPEIALAVARDPAEGFPATLFHEIAATKPAAAVEAANRAVTADTIAKFLFTSGSTGLPKAVINTHRMLCCNQVMIAAALAFPAGRAAGAGRLAAVASHRRRKPQFRHRAAQRRHTLHR